MKEAPKYIRLQVSSRRYAVAELQSRVDTCRILGMDLPQFFTYKMWGKPTTYAQCMKQLHTLLQVEKNISKNIT